jgi:hypothetical protein
MMQPGGEGQAFREHRKNPSFDSLQGDYDPEARQFRPTDEIVDSKKVLLPISKREIMKLFSLPKSARKKHMSLFNVLLHQLHLS